MDSSIIKSVQETYNNIFFPALVINFEYKIIYKNQIAQKLLGELPLGLNLSLHMSEAEAQRLKLIIENGYSDILQINTKSPLSLCFAEALKINTPEISGGKNHPAAILIFDEALDYLISDENLTAAYEIMRHYNSYAVESYAETLSRLGGIALPPSSSPGVRRELEQNFYKTYRVQKHFLDFLNNHLSKQHFEYNKKPYVISELLNELKKRLASYTTALGYRINLTAENSLFIQNLNLKDFYTVILILIACALKFTRDGRADINFNVEDVVTSSVINIKFNVKKELSSVFENIIHENVIDNLSDLTAINLKLARTICENNSIKLNMNYTAGDSSACFMLILHKARDYDYGLFRSSDTLGELSSAVWLDKLIALELSDLTEFDGSVEEI